MQAGGILCFTTHGKYVVERIRSGEKTYGAVSEGRDVISGYDLTGYGFGPYPNMADYGISATKVANVAEMLDDANLPMLSFIERGWVKHQDFFSCHR